MISRISGFANALLFATVTIFVFNNECLAAKASADDLSIEKMQAYVLQNEGPVSGGLTRLQRRDGYKTNIDALVANFKAQTDPNAPLSTFVDKIFEPILTPVGLTEADRKIQTEWAALKTSLLAKYSENTLSELKNLPDALLGRKDAFNTKLDQWIANTLAGGGVRTSSGFNTGTGNGTCWRLSYRNLKRACHCQQCQQCK